MGRLGEMREYGTLELILHWGKMQPSGQTQRVKSLVTNKTYDMSLNGFLYYVQNEEIEGKWILLKV
jgi:hypothetical protein